MQIRSLPSFSQKSTPLKSRPLVGSRKASRTSPSAAAEGSTSTASSRASSGRPARRWNQPLANSCFFKPIPFVAVSRILCQRSSRRSSRARTNRLRLARR